jgi:hypothetical protein
MSDTIPDALPPNKGFLGFVERTGNRLPDPVFLFLWLILGLICLSLVGAWQGWSAVNPVTGEILRDYWQDNDDGAAAPRVLVPGIDRDDKSGRAVASSSSGSSGSGSSGGDDDDRAGKLALFNGLGDGLVDSRQGFDGEVGVLFCNFHH